MTVTTPITTPFKWETTAAEVVAGIDLAGCRVIVTGGASGIGLETARALATTNAEVTLAVRDADAGKRVASEIEATTGNTHILVAPVDLADPASVASFVAAWDGPLNILVNNAGVMACPQTRTPQGWELQFATNHLGLRAGRRAAPRARCRQRGPHRLGQLPSAPALAGGLRRHPFPQPRLRAVGRLRTVEDRQHAFRGGGDQALGRRRHHRQRPAARRRPVHPAALHHRRGPGTHPRTHRRRQRKLPLEDPRAGSRNLGAARDLTAAPGDRRPLLRDCNQAGPSPPGTGRGVAPYALDPDAATRLWEISLQTLAS